MRQAWQYNGIRECNEEYGDSIEFGCAYFHVSRSAYYAWLSGKSCKRSEENQQIAKKVEQIHMQHPDKGCRRIRDDLQHDFGINVTDKLVLKICREKKIKATPHNVIKQKVESLQPVTSRNLSKICSQGNNKSSRQTGSVSNDQICYCEQNIHFCGLL